jgi:hypothetical protein
MKAHFLSIVFVMVSCGKTSEKKETNFEKDSLKVENNSSVDSIASSNQTSDSDFKATAESDSLKKIVFWKAVVIPILNHDKQTVISNTDFPILGHWVQMMKLNKNPKETNRQDFEKVYDRFFNSDFLKELKKKTPNDINIFNRGSSRDTLWYSFYVQRRLGLSEGGLALIFFQNGKAFKLKDVQGVGGDFYAKIE